MEAVLIINIIPAVMLIIMLVRAVKLIKQSAEYTEKPAVTPFEPVRKLQTGLIGLLVANCILGFNFIFPLLSVMLEEFSDDSEIGGTIAALVGFLLIMLYIVAFVMTIIGFVKFSAAKKVNDRIVAQNAGFNNQPYGVPGFSGNGGGFQPIQNQNASYPRANQGAAPPPQNLNGFRVMKQNPANDVPAGYEAPPDLNGYNNPCQNRYSPQPNKYVNPAYSRRPANPVQPVNPAFPMGPANPSQPVNPTYPPRNVNPANPLNSPQPVKSVNSAPSAQPVSYEQASSELVNVIKEIANQPQASAVDIQAVPMVFQGFPSEIPPMAAPLILPIAGIGADEAQNGIPENVPRSAVQNEAAKGAPSPAVQSAAAKGAPSPAVQSAAPKGVTSPAVQGAELKNVSSPALKPDLDILLQTDILQQEKEEANAELPQMPQLPPMPELKTVNTAFGEKLTPFENKAEKRCPHCGVVNPEKNNFCEFCGKEL